MADSAVTRPAGTILTAGFDAAMRHCLDGFADHESPTHFFTALSGGPDSTALACLAQDYATRHDLRHTALIVDHRIRDDSTAEAHRVAGRMHRLGITVEVLTVSDDAPQTGIQAWARECRYDLMLARAHRANGCLLLKQLEQRLGKDFPALKTRHFSKATFCRPMTAELRGRIASGCSAAIVALAD